MKLLKFGVPKKKTEFSKKVTCKQSTPGDAIGCGARVELDAKDVYKETVVLGNQMRIGYHFMCPACHQEGFLKFSEMPEDIEFLEKPEWLRLKRDSLLFEIFDLASSLEDTKRLSDAVQEETEISVSYLQDLGLVA